MTSAIALQLKKPERYMTLQEVAGSETSLQALGIHPGTLLCIQNFFVCCLNPSNSVCPYACTNAACHANGPRIDLPRSLSYHTPPRLTLKLCEALYISEWGLVARPEKPHTPMFVSFTLPASPVAPMLALHRSGEHNLRATPSRGPMTT